MELYSKLNFPGIVGAEDLAEAGSGELAIGKIEVRVVK